MWEKILLQSLWIPHTHRLRPTASASNNWEELLIWTLTLNSLSASAAAEGQQLPGVQLSSHLKSAFKKPHGRLNSCCHQKKQWILSETWVTSDHSLIPSFPQTQTDSRVCIQAGDAQGGSEGTGNGPLDPEWWRREAGVRFSLVSKWTS